MNSLPAWLNAIAHTSVMLVFGIVFATAIVNYLVRRFLVQLELKAAETHNIWDDALVKAARRPAGWFIWVVGIGWATELVPGGDDGITALVEPTRFVLLIGLMAFFLIKKAVFEC